MSHDQETTIADVLRGRMATYQFLSRLFRVEVDQELYDTLMSMRFPANTGNALVDEGYRMICGYLSQADGTVLTELAVDYVRAFIGSGNDGFSAAYPYESVYTSPKRLMMQDARDEVLVLYRAFAGRRARTISRWSWSSSRSYASALSGRTRPATRTSA